MPAKRPNILLLMVDQMTVKAMPSYCRSGDPAGARTPHLSALAERSVVFDAAYCNSPLCAPSRFSFMTGQLPSAIGAYDNAADLAADTPTFAHYLRLAGYRTALAGKMHFCGPDQLHGFEERLTTDIYPADYGWTVDWERPEHRPTWYHNMSSVTEAGPVIRTNQLDFDEEAHFTARRFLFEQARSDDQRPFCLVASFTHPHDPYATPPAYWNLYRDEDIDLPEVSIAAEEQDPHSKRLRRVYDLEGRTIGEDQIRRARRAYYGSISFVDAQIGSLLQTLEETGLDDDTIVVFCGDHGDMLGERGLWYKMSWFEGSARVPLMIKAPGDFTPRRIAQSVSLVDLLPTLAELASDGQAPAYAAPLDGRSLLPHLSGSAGHDEVFGEYMGEGAIAPLLMIRRDRFKYVCSAPDPEQLFDLVADPQEMTNLAQDPTQKNVLTGFRKEATARWDQAALRKSVLASQRRRRLVDAAMKQGKLHSWDHQPQRDAAQLYMRNHLDLDDLERLSRLACRE